MTDNLDIELFKDTRGVAITLRRIIEEWAGEFSGDPARTIADILKVIEPK